MQKNRFTLVEILMVAAMICLIMAVILVAYNGIYRSWASSNTAGVMMAARLPLDKYRQENGMYPTGHGTLGSIADGKEELKKELHNACSPFSHMNGSTLLIFDDFGAKPPKAPQEIYYCVFDKKGEPNSFILMSKGKDGKWGGEDDIIFLPHGLETKNLEPGLYICNVDDPDTGKFSGEIEPLAQ